MKKISTLCLFLCISLAGFSTTWSVVSSGFTFSPDSITVQLGDSVHFALGGSHNAVEVSLATYNANGTTSNGGFNVAFGGGGVSPSLLTMGVHYYVCTNHASMGMKGRIYVINTVGIPSVDYMKSTFSLFPNPSAGRLTVNFSVTGKSNVTIRVISVLGQKSTMMLSETMNQGTYVHSFDMHESMFAKGVYILEMMVGETRSTERFIVE